MWYERSDAAKPIPPPPPPSSVSRELCTAWVVALTLWGHLRPVKREAGMGVRRCSESEFDGIVMAFRPWLSEKPMYADGVVSPNYRTGYRRASPPAFPTAPLLFGSSVCFPPATIGLQLPLPPSPPPHRSLAPPPPPPPRPRPRPRPETVNYLMTRLMNF